MLCADRPVLPGAFRLLCSSATREAARRLRQDRSLSLRALERINRVCIEFEAGWKRGERPRIEDSLGDATGQERSELLRELILLDIDYRRKRGEKPRPEEYENRFPDCTPLIMGTASTAPVSQPFASDSVGEGAKPRETETDRLLDRIPDVAGYKILGSCVLCGYVGQGGMSHVYQGWHTVLDIRVAVKCLKPSLAEAGEHFVSRFQREARIAARVEHPNLTRVYEVGCEHGLNYLILGYVDGETARNRVRRKGPLSTAEAVSIAFKAARGLAAAHNNGVIHRDVKPENILISTQGKVKLADLGLAKSMSFGDTRTASQLILGTPTYMPPEQYEGLAKVGPASDVYALGATLYFLLAGVDPYSGQSYVELMHNVCTKPFPDIPDAVGRTTSGLADVVRKSTAKKPEARYPNALEFAKALHPFFVKVKDKSILRDLNAGDDGSRSSAQLVLPPRHVLARIRAASQDSSPSAGRERGQPWLVATVVFCLAAAAILGCVSLLTARKDTSSKTGPSPASTASLELQEARRCFADAKCKLSRAWTKERIAELISPVQRLLDFEPLNADARETLVRLKRRLDTSNLLERTETRVDSPVRWSSWRLLDAVRRLEVALEREPNYPGAAEKLALSRRRLVQRLEAEEKYAVALQVALNCLQTTEVDDRLNLEILRRVIRDLKPKARGELSDGLRIEKPQPNSVCGESSVLLQGTVDYDLDVSVRIKNRGERVQYLDQRFDVNLKGVPDGPQTLTVEVFDEENDLTATKSVDITVDTTPPVLTIEAPEEWARVTSPVHLEGTVTDAWSQVESVRVNGEEVRIDSGRWETDIHLEPGKHKMKVTAKDSTGHQSAAAERNLEVEPHDLGVYANRRDKESRRESGENKKTETAVLAALEWLHRHQSSDGSWKSQDFIQSCKTPCRNLDPAYGNGRALLSCDVGVTGLAVLAFTGHGHTHISGRDEAFGKCLQKALEYMKSVQVRSEDPTANGRFGPADRRWWIYEHAIATLAMAELLVLSNDYPELEESVRDAARLCLEARNEGRGWGYGFKTGDNDTSVTGWMVQAIWAAKQARLGIDAEEYDRAFEGALRQLYLATGSNGKTGYIAPGDHGAVWEYDRGGSRQFKTSVVSLQLVGNSLLSSCSQHPYSKRLSCMTAGALFCRLLAGQSRREQVIRDGVNKILMHSPPRWQETTGRSPSKVNFYYWYHGSCALFQYGTRDWEVWSKHAQRALLENQRSGGDEHGSWDPIGEWGLPAGRVYSTALGALTLQTCYRLTRIASW